MCVEHRGRGVELWGAELDRWFDAIVIADSAQCLMASVQPQVGEALLSRLRRRPWGETRAVTGRDVPIEVRTREPARVGVDRLLDAFAVNRLRAAGAPAIVVSMGTAVTVNLVAADGAFEGGAIFAGPVLALDALHAGTASLPAVGAAGLAEPPEIVGKSTEEALVAGAYWGGVGAVSELVRRMAESLGSEPEFYLTGGGAPPYAAHVRLNGRAARHVPNMVLSALRLIAEDLGP